MGFHFWVVPYPADNPPLAPPMKTSRAFLIAAGLALAAAPEARAQVSLTSATYAQNFNTLGTANITVDGGNLGAHNSALTGWYFLEGGSGTTALTTITASTGSLNSGDTYNYGSAAAADRALGGLGSGSKTYSIGFKFTNNTGSTITALDVSYIGEMWRLQTANDTLAFSYQASDVALNAASGWTSVSALNFTTPLTGTAAAVDGNATANRTSIANSITGLSIANGATVTFRWADATGSTSAGMSIDDFSLTATLQALTFGNYWAPVAGGGGSGTWTSTSALWSDAAAPAAAGTASQATTGALVFGDAAGTVTVSGTVTVPAGLSFVTDGYILTGGTVSLTGADAAANSISVAAATGATINSALTASNGFTKTGAGNLTLGGTNTLGAVSISQGGLVLASAGALGDTASGTTVDSGATLDLNGQTVGAEAIALSGVLSNGSLTTAASLSGAVTLAGTAGISATSALTLTGGTSGTGSFTKTGAGSLTFSTLSALHEGGTTVSAGSLVLGGVAHASDISVATGATLSGSGTVAGAVTLASGATLSTVTASSATLALGSLTANGGTIALDLADTLTIGGVLTLGGNVSLTLANLGASPVAGVYNLLSFASLVDGGFGITLDTSAPAGYSFSGLLGTDGYALTITQLSRNLTYAGTGAWNTSTASWSDGSGNVAFVNGDNVTFDDSTDGGEVVVAEGVTFGTLTFTNNASNYGFTGAGLAGSGKILVNGAATVAFNAANTFTSEIEVRLGQLVVGDAAGLGSTAGGTTVGASGELVLANQVAVGAEAVSLAGRLVGTGGRTSLAGAITLTGNATLTTTVDWAEMTLSGAIAGAGQALAVQGDGHIILSGGLAVASLTKSGAGTLTLSAASTISTGTTLSAGTINANHGNAFGAGTLTLNGGSLGNTSGAAVSVLNPVAVGGDIGLGTATSTGAINLGGPIDLGGAARTLTVADSGASFGGPVSNGSLTKAGTGTLSVNGPLSVTAVTVNDGTLRLGGAGGFGSATVSFGETATAAARIQLNGKSATLTSLAGNGTVENGGATASTLTLNAGSDITLSAALVDGTGGGTLALTKRGVGRAFVGSLNLGGGAGQDRSTYSGGTNLDEGSILATQSGALGTGLVTVKDATALVAANGVTLANAINVRPSAAGGFIISEQVEGVSNNKYLELYNGTGETINLSQYQIANFSNGASVSTGTVNLGSYQATLGAGEVLVLRNNSAALVLPPGVTTYVSTATFFGGDDAFALQRTDGTNVDIFGVIGSDPGTAWTATNGNTTINTTLVRNANVLTGVSINPPNTTSPEGFLTLGTEWTQYPIDTVSDLGSHTMNLPAAVGATIGTEEESASVAFTGAVSLGSKALLTSASGSTVTFSGAVSGSAGFEKVGAGKVVLSGDNTFSGASSVSAGTLELGSATALGTSTLTVTGGTLDVAGQAVGNTIVLNGGSITGTGALTADAELVIQSGTLAFVGLDTFGAAGLTLSGGTLDLNSLNPTNVITFVSGSFLNATNWSGSVAPTGSGDVTGQLAGLAGIGGGVLLSFAQSANLGGLSINVSSNGAVLSGLGTYTGTLTLTGGAQSFAGLGDLGFQLYVNSGATANFGSGGLLCGTQTHFRSGGAILGSDYVGTVNVLGTDVSITGLNMTSTAILNVATGNSITLTEVINNAITLTGGSINGLNLIGGQLTLRSALSTNTAIGAFGGNSSVKIGLGGRLGGNAIILGDLLQESGSILGPGNSPGIIQVQGDVTLAGGAIYEVEAIRVGSIANPAGEGTDYDTTTVGGDLILSNLSSTQRYIIRLVSIDADSDNVVAEDFVPTVDFDLVLFSVAGVIDLGGKTLSDLFVIETNAVGKSFLAADGVTPIDASRFSVSIENSNLVLNYSAIPEPSTYGLMVGGLALALAAFRRRRKQPTC